MVTNQGVNAGRGFTYQYAYACWRIADLLRKGSLVSITLEGNEDLDLIYREGNYQITEFIQLKTREEGTGNWTVRDFTQSVLAPFFEKRTFEKDFSCFHFVTDGNSDSNLVRLRDEIIPRIIQTEDLDSDTERLLQEVFEMLQPQLAKKGQTLRREDLLHVLKKVKITTRSRDLETMRTLTHAQLTGFNLDEQKTNQIHDNLFAKISHLSGLRNIGDRTLSGRTIALDLGLPWAIETAETHDMHDLKGPAESWYVHREEEEELSHYLKRLSNGMTENLMVTGESGIGKSSFLNHASHKAKELDIHAIKLRVLQPNLETFLDQLADSIEGHFETKTQRAPRDSKNRLIAVLTAVSKASSRPVLLLIDQFERLFEEWTIRIDVLRIRDLWKIFSTIIVEINKIGKISFILTCRTHYFLQLLPSGTQLQNLRFSYLTLQKFGPQEANDLLDSLLSFFRREMTKPAKELFLGKTEREPQMIILTFINIFGNRSDGLPVDEPELQKNEPWNDVFRNDIDLLRENELHKLIIFAMAGIGRELCTASEIAERIEVLGGYSRRQIEEALLAIQNTNRLINQPKKGGFSFYHRNVGDFILKHYRYEFPLEWAEEGVVLDVHKMLKEEIHLNRNLLQTRLSVEKIKIIEKYAEKLILSNEEIKFIIGNCLNHNLPLEYWVTRSLSFNRTILSELTTYLDSSQIEAREQILLLLIRFGKEEFIGFVENYIFEDFLFTKKVRHSESLIRQILTCFEENNYLPDAEDRMIFCIRLSILYFERLAYWLKHRPQLIESAFESLLPDLQNKETPLVRPVHIPFLFASINAIGNDKITDSFFSFIESFLGKGHTEETSFTRDFHIRLGPSVLHLVTRIQHLVDQRAFEQAGCYLRFFMSHHFGQTRDSRIKEEVGRMALTIKARPGTNKSEIDFLQLASTFLVREPAYFQRIRVKLRDLLAASGQPNNVIQAISLSLQLKDYRFLKKMIARFTKTSSNFVRNEDIQSLLNILIKIMKDRVCLEHLPLKDLGSAGFRLLKKQDGPGFFVPLHGNFIDFFQQYLAASKEAGKVIGLLNKIHRCNNDFLQTDIRGLLLLELDRAGVSVPVDELSSICTWFREAESKISRSLILQYEELKGDVLMRRARLLRLAKQNDREVAGMAIQAYEVAIKYYQERVQKNDEHYENLINCAEKLILLFTGLHPGLAWRSILIDLDGWELYSLSRQLQRNNHMSIFHEVVEVILYQEPSVNKRIKMEMADGWVKTASHSHDYSTICLCWDFMTNDMLHEVVASMPYEVEPTSLDTIHAKAIELGDAGILGILAYNAQGDHVRFPNLVKRYFEALVHGDKDASYYSLAWMATAIEMGNEEIFELSWKYIDWKEVSSNDIRDWLKDHDRLLIRTIEEPTLAGFKKWLTGSPNPLYTGLLDNYPPPPSNSVLTTPPHSAPPK